jgi:spore coat polysaccharide biosynthesis predicted glycosyltransferase SpsG
VAAHARRWYTRTEPRHRRCLATRLSDIIRLRSLLVATAGTDVSKLRLRVMAELKELEEACRKDAERSLTPSVRPRNVDVRSRVA